MSGMWWQTLAGVLSGLVLMWLGLLGFLWRARPDARRLGEAARLLPAVIRLISRLARDRTLPRGLRYRLWFLLGYLALPIDLVPDVIPVIGYADDAVLVVWTLRSVVRVAGAGALARHWPGTPAGLHAVESLAGLDQGQVPFPRGRPRCDGAA